MRVNLFSWVLMVALAIAVKGEESPEAIALTSEGDIEIVGFEVNCGDNSLCDEKAHLICDPKRGVCLCDHENNFYMDLDANQCLVFSLEMSDEDSSEENVESGHDDNVDVNASVNVNAKKEEKEDDDEGTKSGENETKWPMKEEDWKFPEFGNETGKIIGEVQVAGEADYDDKDSQEDYPLDEANASGDEGKSLDARTIGKAKDKNAEQVPVEKEVKGQGDNIGVGSPSVNDNDDRGIVKEEMKETESDESVDGAHYDLDMGDYGWGDWSMSEEDYGHSNEEDKLGERENVSGKKCKLSDECTNSKLGSFSHCNPDEERCECSDTEGKSRDVFLVNGTCYVMKEYGSECKGHDECQAVMKGKAWCHLDQDTQTKYCTCQPFFLWDQDFKECLPIADNGLNSSCKNDLQCSSREALGPLSRCSEVSGTCECWPTEGVLLHEGKCVHEVSLKGKCVTDGECQGSLGTHAFCHSQTSLCACKEGHLCSKFLVRPAMSPYTLFVLLVITTAVIVGGVLALLLKRRGAADTYAFLQNTDNV